MFLFKIVGYIRNLIDDTRLDLKLGFVQTAYANGSSTHYVQDELV